MLPQWVLANLQWRFLLHLPSVLLRYVFFIYILCRTASYLWYLFFCALETWCSVCLFSLRVDAQRHLSGYAKAVAEMLPVSETARGSALVEIIFCQFCVLELINKVLLVTGDLGGSLEKCSSEVCDAHQCSCGKNERCKVRYFLWVYHTASCDCRRWL